MGMLYVILTVVSGFSEGTYFGGTGVATIWNAMTSFRALEITGLITLIEGIVVTAKDMMVGLFEILTWKFSFFVDEWAIFRWILMSISLSIIIGFILALRGTSSG